MRFDELNLSAEVLHAINDLGYEEPTPIQEQSIEAVMTGRDLIGQSQTGTGKTAAFGIPTLEMIDGSSSKVQALILCPTRELAIQVNDEFRKLAKYMDNVRVLPIYGGQPIDRQITALKKGVQIVIGTPGRVMDHMRRKTIRLDNVKMVVLDEADEMLDMGFREDIEEILLKIPENRQIVLFSATMSSEIMKITKEFQEDPEIIKVVHKELTVPSIEQVYFEVRERDKMDALCRLIDMYDPDLSLIFCNTKKRVDEVADMLQARGYFAEALHGDLKQPQRDKVMGKFRTGHVEILVATDVAARGIDVTDINIVFNYDIPQDEEYYVHRIGRTGRAGKTGKAFSFVVGKEIYKLKDIIRYAKAKIKQQQLPTLRDIEEIKTIEFSEKVKRVIEEGHLTKYINIAESIMEADYTSMDIAAALLKMSLQNIDSEGKSDSLQFVSSYSEPQGKRKGDKSDTDRYSKSRSDMVRIFINVGSVHKVRPKDIVGAIAGEVGIKGKEIGDIDIFQDYTFVDIPKEWSKQTVKVMEGKKIKGKKLHLELAKAKKRSNKGDKE